MASQGVLGVVSELPLLLYTVTGRGGGATAPAPRSRRASGGHSLAQLCTPLPYNPLKS